MIASAKLSTEGGIPDSGGKIRMQNLAENLDILAARLEPRPSQAEVLDQKMRARLADSLSYIGKACEGRVSFDDALHQKIIGTIRSQAIPAQTFAAYGDLVLALDENEVSAAENLFAEIAVILSAPREFGLFRFRPPAECTISKTLSSLDGYRPDAIFSCLASH